MAENKIPGANCSNIPLPGFTEAPPKPSSPLPPLMMPGIAMEDIASKSKKPKPFSMKDYRVRIKRFCLSSPNCEDLISMERLMDSCVHSDTSRMFLIERKDTFTKEGDLISVFFYMEPRDAEYHTEGD